MTTSNDAKTPLAPQKSRPDRENPKQKTSVSTPNRLYIFAATIAIGLVGLGCAIYAIQTNVQLRHGTEEQVHFLLSQINTLKQQQIDNKDQFENIMKETNESKAKLQNKLDTIDKNLQSALKQHLYQSNDWLLLKARYYLELAQINAQWSKDSQTTSALLQQADILLVTIHDQRSFAIRQAIAKEIAQLNAMPKLDMAGLLSQLDAALTTVADMPLKATLPPVNKNNIATTNNASSSAWRERLKESVGLLEELVVVRRHDEEILPLPSPAYEAMLREGIRLNLQETQWAVLQSNEPVFQLSLTQAIKNINRSFALDAAGTNELIKKLNTMQQIHLVQQKPILEQSLPLLNQFIESKDTQATDIKPTAAGDNS